MPICQMPNANPNATCYGLFMPAQLQSIPTSHCTTAVPSTHVVAHRFQGSIRSHENFTRSDPRKKLYILYLSNDVPFDFGEDLKRYACTRQTQNPTSHSNPTSHRHKGELKDLYRSGRAWDLNILPVHVTHPLYRNIYSLNDIADKIFIPPDA